MVSDRPPVDADVAATRAFFGPRAAGWEERFPDDGPRYEGAVEEMTLSRGAVVVDAGCGTGRALPALRRAVGPEGMVVGVDVTAEMLIEAVGRGRAAAGAFVLGDARRLPLPTAAVDGVFAGGLVTHLADPVAGLAELARVCRPGAMLALFHPIGRQALARRHGGQPEPGDVRRQPNLRRALDASGWQLDTIDDGEDRYLALAQRR